MTAVDRLYAEFSALVAALDASEVSLRTGADDNFRKVLLMAAASHFERSMTDTLLDFVERVTAENHPLTWLIKNKVANRQYHTWFDWDRKNANPFFGLFGSAFKDHMAAEVARNNRLESSIRAFLELGSERNRLVHQDFANFSLEKTSEEIYRLYSDAKMFVEWFPDALQNFTEERGSRGTDKRSRI